MCFLRAPARRLFAYAHSDGGKRPRSKCGRIKISHPITKSEFFVETLWSIATFRVSEEKFLISFWQRFFFLWLRFFLFGRSKKKEMNKTAFYTTGYFAYAQYDTPSPRGAPRLGRKDMGKMPVPQVLKVVGGMGFFAGVPPKTLRLRS